jgi:molybdopterin molybdotransferase
MISIADKIKSRLRRGQPEMQPEHTSTEMLGEIEARARILDQVEALPAEPLPLLRAAGRFSSREILATHALPGFDNSAMDGYAVGFEGAAMPAGAEFMVSGEQAVRIFTGAPVPAGTRAIVMQEDVQRTGDRIVVTEPVAEGEYIRRAGADVARGQRLMGRGEKLTPQRIGLLASQGLATINVSRAARVAILATGDELQAPGRPLGAGEIYESNSTLLASLAAPLGAEISLIERARDDREDLEAILTHGLSGHDVLVVAGGVSVGERDLVKTCLGTLGVELDLWRVRIQPGKPFLYGWRRDPGGGQSGGRNTHVFGLPGNPVSAFVTFLLFVRPAILRLMGAADAALALPAFAAATTAELVQTGNRPHYVRGMLDVQGGFIPAGRQESHALFGLSRSNALVRVEAESRVPVGQPVTAYVWSL